MKQNFEDSLGSSLKVVKDFSRGIDVQQLLDRWFFAEKDIEDKREGEIYREDLGDGFSYLVIKRNWGIVDINKRPAYSLVFRLIDEDQVAESNGGGVLSEVVLDSASMTEKGGGFLTMSHRFVESQENGVRGSDFLRKVEDNVHNMMEQGLLEDIDGITVETGQVSVIQLLLKNGYHFATEAEDGFYKEIFNGKFGYSTKGRATNHDNKEGVGDSNIGESYIVSWYEHLRNILREKLGHDPVHYGDLSVRFILQKIISY